MINTIRNFSIVISKKLDLFNDLFIFKNIVNGYVYK
jgi:hypothetical protein